MWDTASGVARARKGPWIAGKAGPVWVAIRWRRSPGRPLLPWAESLR